MSITGTEDHSITLSEAAALTANYRASIAVGDTIAHMMGKQAIVDILAQTDCVGLRVYYGLTDDGEKQLVFCGVDEDGNDLYEGLLAERSFLCPTACSASNPLNTSV